MSDIKAHSLAEEIAMVLRGKGIIPAKDYYNARMEIYKTIKGD